MLGYATISPIRERVAGSPVRALTITKDATHRRDTADEVIPSCNKVQGAPATMAFLGAMVTWYL
jgi:hypothetical protein